MKTLLTCLGCLITLCVCANVHYGFQCPDGKPPPCKPTPTPKPPSPTPKPPTPTPAPTCYPAELLVRCGLPGCAVALTGKQAQQGIANEQGDLTFSTPQGKYTVKASKPGYEDATATVQLDCGGAQTVPLKLTMRPLTLRIRTTPPECEIIVDRVPKGRSDARGLFSFQANSLAMMIEARKEGFLSSSKGIQLEPGKPEQEIALALSPIPAMLTISANFDNAQVRVDQQTEQRAVNEEIALPPGRHQLTVEALGHKPVTLEVNLPPGAKEKRSVRLDRLPLAELAQQAEAALKSRAYASVLKLCGYMFEADAASPIAHRLAGLARLAEQNYGAAEPHLARALAGGETISLPVRRHLGENFDPNRGHDVCQAVLLLGKSEVEFRGLQIATEDFKVPYSQAQMLRLETRGSGNRALALSVKVTLAGGRKRDYSFFSPDKEISLDGKPYLEMLQRLLQAH